MVTYYYKNDYLPILKMFKGNQFELEKSLNLRFFIEIDLFIEKVV